MLRAEVLGSLQAQHAALSYGIAALALIIAAVATSWEKAPVLSEVALMGGLPLGSAFVLTVWATEVARMTRVMEYMAGYVEPRLNRAAEPRGERKDYLVYAQWLAGRLYRHGGRLRPRSLRLGQGLIGGIVAFLAITAFFLGAFRFDNTANLAKHCASAVEPDPLCPGSLDRAASEVPYHVPFYFRYWSFSVKDLHKLELPVAIFVFLLVPIAFGVLMLRKIVRKPEDESLPDLVGANLAAPVHNAQPAP